MRKLTLQEAQELDEDHGTGRKQRWGLCTRLYVQHALNIFSRSRGMTIGVSLAILGGATLGLGRTLMLLVQILLTQNERRQKSTRRSCLGAQGPLFPLAPPPSQATQTWPQSLCLGTSSFGLSCEVSRL